MTPDNIIIRDETEADIAVIAAPPEHLINHKEHDMSEKKPPAATPPRPTPSPGRQKKGKAGGYVAPPPPKPMTPSKKGR